MLNPILSFSATRRMRTFKTMLIVIAYEAALLLLALALMSPFLRESVTMSSMHNGLWCYILLLGAQFGLLILIAPVMTSGAIAGERERQTLDLLLVTNTQTLRILAGKVLESFALLALLIVCGMPVMSLCLLTGSVTIGQLLLGTLFLLATAFACVSVGVFCSSLARSSVLAGVLSYLTILAIGVVTALPFFFGYPQAKTDILYDKQLYAQLTAGEALRMIPALMYVNPAFGLICLIQGQTNILSSRMEYPTWGRLYATWLMADRAGWETAAVISAGAMVLAGLILLAFAALMIRRGKKTIKHR